MLFQSFFDLVGVPSCIMTDQQIAIKSALTNLKNGRSWTG